MGPREEVLQRLEGALREPWNVSALQASRTIPGPENAYRFLQRHRADMRFLLIASGVEIKKAASGNGSTGIHVEVSRAPGAKCERCWNYSLEVGKDERYPTVCERCLAALSEIEKQSVQRMRKYHPCIA